MTPVLISYLSFFHVAPGYLALNVEHLHCSLVGAMEIIEGRLTMECRRDGRVYGYLAWPTFALGWVMSMRERGRASMERINEILDRVSDIPEGEEELVPGRLRLRLKAFRSVTVTTCLK